MCTIWLMWLFINVAHAYGIKKSTWRANEREGAESCVLGPVKKDGFRAE